MPALHESMNRAPPKFTQAGEMEVDTNGVAQQLVLLWAVQLNVLFENTKKNINYLSYETFGFN